MEHNFNVEIACLVGINAAVLYQNIYFWCEHNRANETNIHEGRAWTYNSAQAFSELFPYMTRRQVEGGLSKLKEAGLILAGNYNTNRYDRTLWYAITDKGYSITPQGGIHLRKNVNGDTENVEPIPDSKPDKNPDDKPVKKEVPKNPYGEFQRVKLTDDEYQKLIGKYGDLTNKAIEILDNYLETKGKDKYKSHYAVLKGWPMEEATKHQPRSGGYDWGAL